MLAALVALPLALGALFALLKLKVTKALRSFVETSSSNSLPVVRRRWKRLIDISAKKRLLKRLVLLGAVASARITVGAAVDLGLRKGSVVDVGTSSLIKGLS